MPPVVNEKVLVRGRWFPARSVAPDVTVTMYLVLAARFPVGVKVATLVDVLYNTLPETGTEPTSVLTLKVVVFTVEAFISSLKVTDTVALRGTLVAPSTGDVGGTIEGAMTSLSVVKVHTGCGPSWLPARSLIEGDTVTV